MFFLTKQSWFLPDMPRVLHYAPLIASIAWFRSPSFAGKLPLFAWLKWNIHEYTPFSDISKSHFCLLSSPFPPPFQLAQAHRRTRSKSALSPGIRQSSGWWFGSPLKQNRQVNYSSSWTFSEKKTFKQKQTPFKILPWKTNYVKPMEKNTNIFQHTKDQASSEVSREHFTISLA